MGVILETKIGMNLPAYSIHTNIVVCVVKAIRALSAVGLDGLCAFASRGHTFSGFVAVTYGDAVHTLALGYTHAGSGQAGSIALSIVASITFSSIWPLRIGADPHCAVPRKVTVTQRFAAHRYARVHATARHNERQAVSDTLQESWAQPTCNCRLSRYRSSCCSTSPRRQQGAKKRWVGEGRSGIGIIGERTSCSTQAALSTCSPHTPSSHCVKSSSKSPATQCPPKHEDASWQAKSVHWTEAHRSIPVQTPVYASMAT